MGSSAWAVTSGIPATVECVPSQMGVEMVHRQECIVPLAIAQVERGHEAQLFQQLERPVHGRLVQAGHASLRVSDNLIRREVDSRLVKDIRDEPPLRRELVPLLSERYDARHRYCTLPQL